MLQLLYAAKIMKSKMYHKQRRVLEKEKPRLDLEGTGE